MRVVLARLVMASACIMASGQPALAIEPQAAGMPLVDHHIHIFSPDASAVFKGLCKTLGPGHCPDEVSKEPATGDDVVRALDAAGIRQGVLLSGAYFFASPAVASQSIDVLGKTRAENAFIVAQAKAHCGRLVATISVNPLWSGAIDEIDYWGKVGGAAALKLHLGNSGFDFRDPAQVKRLAAVFAAADRNHLAIVIHMQTRPSTYGPEDATIFLRDVLPSAPHVTIQIAHVGSGGGLDKGVLAVLAVFAAAIHDKPKLSAHLQFDTAMVPDLFSNKRKLSAAKGDVAELDTVMHKIGMKRFLPASDYTLGLDLKAYFTNQKASFALGDTEWRTIARNRAPYVLRAKCPR